MEPMAERTKWTDERIDDLAQRMDVGFDRLDRDVHDLRTDLTAQIEGLRQTMMQMTLSLGGGMLLGFISLLAAIVART